MNDVIDKNVATYMIYALWIIVLSALNFAGSLGIYQILKRLPGRNESNAKIYAKNSASLLWLTMSVFIVTPWCVPMMMPDFLGFIGIVSGFVLCYALLGMGLGADFDRAARLASPKSDESPKLPTSTERL